MDILLGANLLENLGPDRNGDFAEVCFAEQEHQGAGLADATADSKWNFILQNGNQKKLNKLKPVLRVKIAAASSEHAD